MLDLKGLVLDIRQYAMEADVLKRVLFPETYGIMSEVEWEASDDRQKNRPQKDQHIRVRRNPRPTPVIFETGPVVGESDQEENVEVDPPVTEDSPLAAQSSERVNEPVEDVGREEDVAVRETIEIEDLSDEGERGEEVIEIPESEREEEAEETQEQKRRRREKGKSVAEEEEEPRTSGRPKVVVSEDRGEVLVDLTQDWYRSDNVASLGIAIFSADLEAKMKKASISNLIEFSARHHAISWNITDHFGEEILIAREKEDRAAGALILQELENKKLLREIENSRQRLILSESDKKKLSSQICSVESRLKAAEASLAESEQKIKQYEEKYSEAHSLSQFRGGVTWCLDRLSKHQIIPAEWNNTDKVLDLVSDSDEERVRTPPVEASDGEGGDSSHAE